VLPTLLSEEQIRLRLQSLAGKAQDVTGRGCSKRIDAAQIQLACNTANTLPYWFNTHMAELGVWCSSQAPVAVSKELKNAGPEPKRFTVADGELTTVSSIGTVCI
jgi:hypothetical protein